MPLLDHFHPPLSQQRHWSSFHGFWAATIGEHLNQKLLPQGYFAEMQVHLGSGIEIDVGTFEKGGNGNEGEKEADGNGCGVAVLPWAPPVAVDTIPGFFPEEVEVLVYSAGAGPTLVAAIVLISPSNEDRPESRLAFAIKCGSYLQAGVGLALVDIVSHREANLHRELLQLLGQGALGDSIQDSISAAAYHPVRRNKKDLIDLWYEPLTVGKAFPALPLPVRGLGLLPLPLEATYTEALKRSRLV
jgi:hypothetical protein